jgi:hypothetical protein
MTRMTVITIARATPVTVPVPRAPGNGGLRK